MFDTVVVVVLVVVEEEEGCFRFLRGTLLIRNTVREEEAFSKRERERERDLPTQSRTL